jgi:hypothetical protein
MSQMMQQYDPAEMYFSATLAQVRPQPNGSSTLQDLLDILSGISGGEENGKGSSWLAVPESYNKPRLAI